MRVRRPRLCAPRGVYSVAPFSEQGPVGSHSALSLRGLSPSRSSPGGELGAHAWSFGSRGPGSPGPGGGRAAFPDSRSRRGFRGSGRAGGGELPGPARQEHRLQRGRLPAGLHEPLCCCGQRWPWAGASGGRWAGGTQGPRGRGGAHSCVTGGATRGHRRPEPAPGGPRRRGALVSPESRRLGDPLSPRWSSSCR